MKNIIVMAVVALVVAASTANGSIEVSQFPWCKALQPPTNTANKNVAVFPLDDEIFAATDGNYVNMRIFDQNNVEIPFQVRTQTTDKSVARERGLSLKIGPFQIKPDNRIEIVFEKKASEPIPSAVEFSTHYRNYEKQITVSGSNDRKQWQILAQDQPIYDYSRFIDIRNNRIEITPRQYAYYKVEVSNISEVRQSPLTQIIRETRGSMALKEVEKSAFTKEDFRIDRISFLEKKQVMVKGKKVITDYNVERLNVVQDQKEKTTILTFSTARQPLTALTVLAQDSNFSRPITIEATDATDAKSGWQTLLRSRISRIDIGRFHKDASTMGLGAPRRFRHYKITVQNLDNPPLNITGVTAKGEVHEVIFFRKPGEMYQLYYGGKNTPEPRYDIGSVLRKVGIMDADIFKAGAGEANPSYGMGRKSYSINTKLLLVISIIVVVIVLALVIAATSRKMGRINTPLD